MSDMNDFNNNNGQIIDPQQTKNVSKNRKTSKILSIISLCINVLVFGYLSFILIADKDYILVSSFHSDMIDYALVPGFIVSVILMIIARVKDRKNKMAFVLMWAYIAEAIIVTIALVVLFLFFYLMCNIFGCV